MTALLCATLALLVCGVSACGSDDDDGGPSPRPDAVGDCLKRNESNLVRFDTLPDDEWTAWVRARLPREALSDAYESRLYGPLDVGFGEEVDGTIIAPAETSLLFFEDEDAARRHEDAASFRRGSILVTFRSEAGERYRETVKDCL